MCTFVLLYTKFITRYLKLTFLCSLLCFSLFTVQNVTQTESSSPSLCLVLIITILLELNIERINLYFGNLFWVWGMSKKMCGWILFTFYCNRRCDFIRRGSQEGIKKKGKERNFDDQTSFDKTSRTHLEMTKDIYCMSMRHETIKILLWCFIFSIYFWFCIRSWILLCYFTYFDCFWSIKLRD